MFSRHVRAPAASRETRRRASQQMHGSRGVKREFGQRATGSESCGRNMRILLALLVVCAASAGLWASLDRPLNAPDWTGQLKGVSYSPSHLYSENDKDQNVTDELIRRD